jgi:hypothetical protein
MVVRSLLCAGLASIGLAAIARADVPTVVHCGQVITRDTTVANDLTGCHRYGLIIGADDITLDLNGHTIGGDGTFTPTAHVASRATRASSTRRSSTDSRTTATATTA